MNEENYSTLMKNLSQTNNESGKYFIQDNKIYRKCKNGNRRVIQRFEMEPVLYLVHDEPTAGHSGIEKCYDKLKKRFYWKGMKKDVEIYIKSCDQC